MSLNLDEEGTERDRVVVTLSAEVEERLVWLLCNWYHDGSLTKSGEFGREKDLRAPLEQGAQEDFQDNIIN